MKGTRSIEPKHILVVDDDGDVLDVVAEFLLDLGYGVSRAASAEQMRGFLETADTVDAIVLDAGVHDEPGLSLALDAKSKGVRLVMISGHPDLMKLFHRRADQLLHKPFRQADLQRAIQHALLSETFGQRGEDPD